MNLKLKYLRFQTLKVLCHPLSHNLVDLCRWIQLENHCLCILDLVVHEEEAKKLLELLKKRSRSLVWDHFERYIHGFGKHYDIRAKCMSCRSADYACDTSANGTKSLITHIEKCKEYPTNKEKILGSRQKILSFEKPTQVAIGFNQKEITKACVEMVIMDELPLSFVEGEGFRRLMSRASPKWRVPCRQAIARDILNMYYSERRELRHMLSAYRVLLLLIHGHLVH